MKNVFGVLLLLISSWTASFSQSLKPYTIGEKLDLSMSEAKTFVNDALTKNSFEILGAYQVANDNKRYLYAVTSKELKSIVNTLGGKRGYFAVLRVAITIENGKAIVSYTTPEYWANAYLQSDLSTVSTSVTALTDKFINTFTMNVPYGSKDGLKKKKLKSYHYMMGMPYFDDDVELKLFDSFNAATTQIDNNLAASTKLEKVYEISFPDKAIKLYGVGLNNESSFLSKIDGSSPKHTAFLPYEILVYKSTAYILHGRYRIALAFPDLSMGTFMKIMSTPGDIEKALKEACK